MHKAIRFNLRQWVARTTFPISQRGLLVLLFAFVLACDSSDKPEAGGAPSASQSPPQPSLVQQRVGPPNVILITLDTTRADALGSYGQKRPTSPHLDALAKDGVRFEHTDASAPLTLPSHSSIMTGVHPFRHGVRENAGYKLPDTLLTLAERFSENGYRTGVEIAAHVLNRNTGIQQGFQEFHDLDSEGITKRPPTLTKDGGKPVPSNERDAEDITKFGISFVERNRDKPFFLWLHYFDPHNIYVPPAKYQAQFSDSLYHGEVRFTDDQIGRFLTTLDRFDLRKNTLIVVTADHGEGLYDHGEETHGMFLYEATTRVPLIFSGIDIGPAGKVVGTFVRTIDIAPTILEAVGLPPLENIQGVSLLPLIQGSGATTSFGQTESEELLGYGETLSTHLLFATPILRYLRDREWKYIHKPKPELYDLKADPEEQNNLAEQHPEKVKKLRTQLTKLIAESATPMGTANRQVDSETLRQLQELGYVAASPALELESELQTLELTGPDPGDLLPEIQKLLKLSGYLHTGLNLEEAVQGFQELSQRFPKSLLMSRFHVRSLVKLERPLEALQVYEQLLAVESTFIDDFYGLADVATSIERFDRAIEALERANEIDPCSERAILQLSSLHYSMQRQEQSVAILKKGASACVDNWQTRNNLAYILATTPNANLRDGTRAVALAQEAAMLTRNQRAEVLDSLAAAYAETGQFDKAVNTARAALTQIQQQTSDPETVATYRDHLQLYESSKPLREGG